MDFHPLLLMMNLITSLHWALRYKTMIIKRERINKATKNKAIKTQRKPCRTLNDILRYLVFY